MKLFNKKVLREMMEQGKLKDVADISKIFKEQFGEILEELLKAELDEEMDYMKYDHKDENTLNSPDDKRRKKLNTDHRDLEIDVFEKHEEEFEPKVDKEQQEDISDIEDQILGMYGKEMTIKDIQSHIENIYGFQASPSLISSITDKILPLAKEWQNRPLETLYCHVGMETVDYKVRQDGEIVNKAVYVAIGTNLEGTRDVLGIWICENESSKFWLKVISDIKKRGVEDILIASIDALIGFSDAIKSVFPNTEIQRCIIHQIRNSAKYISYKHRKEFSRDLKLVYQADTKEQALLAFDELDAKWGEEYQIAIRLWRNNWDELATFFKYPPEIRTMLYNTNALEGYNRQLRKVTKSKSVFPTDESLFRMIYLATMNIEKKWTQRYRGWTQILSQLAIFFEDRLNIDNQH